MHEYDYDSPGKEARMWAMVCHLAALSGYFIPFGHILGPFFVWLIKRDVHPYVDQQGKEAINFQISVTIYLVISAILIVVLIGILFLILVPLIALVLVVIAAVKTNDGEDYRYPFTIRLLD